ncbi:MAG TPA: methyltransferase domain-containing protein [Thermoanaerobaculia bacterium]
MPAHPTFVCPRDRAPLVADESSLHCTQCDARYPVDDDIADFARGAYYDSFEPGQQLPPEHLQGLANEERGARWRIERFYGPLLGDAPRVLDCGCGNGLSVDVLVERGHDAYGIDLSALRKWQWRERRERARLAVASALELPFRDGHFDAVISSGVIEHIGVAERGGAHYEVTPLPERDALRARYAGELLRVTRPGGSVYIDAPHGRFPIDFWHSTAAGKPRWHRLDEGFLPTFAELRALAGSARIEALSPRGRFAFKQVGRYWWGRLLAAPAALAFALMPPPLLRSPLNPYLVVRLTRESPPGSLLP